jgi:hypothetical protein
VDVQGLVNSVVLVIRITSKTELQKHVYGTVDVTDSVALNCKA